MLEMHTLRPEEQPEAEALWRACFGDGEEATRLCFDRIPAFGRFLVLTEGGHVRGLAALLPCSLCPGGEKPPRKAGYLYGLCVHPEYRRGGLGRALIQYADFQMENMGCAYGALVPAESWMHRMYQASGFGECFRLRRREVRADSLPAPAQDAGAEPVSPAEYAALRERFLADGLHIGYGTDYLALQAAFSALSGGGFFRIRAGGREGCACADRMPDGGVLVRELLAPGWEEEALTPLSRALPAAAYQVRTPDPAGEPFGMLRLYDPSEGLSWNWETAAGFLGLALD